MARNKVLARLDICLAQLPVRDKIRADVGQVASPSVAETWYTHSEDRSASIPATSSAEVGAPTAGGLPNRMRTALKTKAMNSMMTPPRTAGAKLSVRPLLMMNLN